MCWPACPELDAVPLEVAVLDAMVLDAASVASPEGAEGDAELDTVALASRTDADSDTDAELALTLALALETGTVELSGVVPLFHHGGYACVEPEPELVSDPEVLFAPAGATGTVEVELSALGLVELYQGG